MARYEAAVSDQYAGLQQGSRHASPFTRVPPRPGRGTIRADSKVPQSCRGVATILEVLFARRQPLAAQGGVNIFGTDFRLLTPEATLPTGWQQRLAEQTNECRFFGVADGSTEHFVSSCGMTHWSFSRQESRLATAPIGSHHLQRRSFHVAAA